MKKNQIWFKAKTYGWGWYPSSWEGWLVLLIYISFVCKSFLDIDSPSHTSAETLIEFSVPLLAGTILLIAVCYWKGEKPRWRWSKDKQEKN